MKGVYQTKPTNCIQACVASIFDLSIEAAPDCHCEDWVTVLEDWLRPQGLTLINATFGECEYNALRPAGYTMGAVPTQSKDFPEHWKHCVVCLNGWVVWCPRRGELDGTERAEEYTIIYPMDLTQRK